MRRAVLRCAASGVPLPFSSARQILVVSKRTRYENELRKFKSVHGPSQAAQVLRDAADFQGSDLEWLSRTHDAHEAFVRALVEGLRRLPRQADVKVVKCYGGLQKQHIAAADFVFSMGGDGTFLRTASFIQDTSGVPLVCGINTDPLRSEGFLCVNRGGSCEALDGQRVQDQGAGVVVQPEAVDNFLARLSSDSVRYITRQRIRVNIDGARGQGPGNRLLALNDVLVAEHEAQKASYYELRFTQLPAEGGGVTVEKQKSSGLLVSTGTGSTAWGRSVSGVQPSTVRQILELAGEGKSLADPELPRRVSDAINKALVFAPDSKVMRFVVREPIVNGVFTCDNASGFTQDISVKARSAGVHIFVDGQMTAPLPLSHVANFSIHPEDALQAVHSV